MPGSSFFLSIGSLVIAAAALAYKALHPRRESRHNPAQASRAQTDLEQRLADCQQASLALQAELERVRQDYDRFAYIVSHDLKEPLRSITGFSGLLERRLGEDLPAEALQYLEFITDSSRHLQSLIEGLLEYSRAGAPLPAPQAVALEPLLARVKAQYAVQLEATGAELSVGELPVVSGDPQRLRQLFQHVIGNALKFAGERPLRVQVGAQPDADGWLISVTDNGLGIEAGQQQRVFEVFQRLHAREDYPGIGIGLPICKRIVESHGGRIWLDSAAGRGTTVRFTLPSP